MAQDDAAKQAQEQARIAREAANRAEEASRRAAEAAKEARAAEMKALELSRSKPKPTNSTGPRAQSDEE